MFPLSTFGVFQTLHLSALMLQQDGMKKSHDQMLDEIEKLLKQKSHLCQHLVCWSLELVFSGLWYFLSLGYFQGPLCIDCCILIRYSGVFADIFISNWKKIYWTFQLDDDWNVQYTGIFKYVQRIKERSLKQTYQGKGLFYEL